MSHRFFENKECEYYPCHKGMDKLNCLFCYCPMYHLEDCPGNPGYKIKNGIRIKVCTQCIYPHEAGNYDKINEIIRNRG